MVRDPVVWLPAGLVGLIAGTTFSPACAIPMLSRAQWYREQANLALQRGRETRDPTVRAGFGGLVVLAFVCW